MGLESESFLVLYELGNPGCVHHLCVGVDNYNPVNWTSGGEQLYFDDLEGFLIQMASTGSLANCIRPVASATFARFAEVLSGLS